MAEGTLYGGGPLQVVGELHCREDAPSVGEEFARARKRRRDEQAALVELAKGRERHRRSKGRVR